MIVRKTGDIFTTDAKIILNPIDTSGIGVLKFNDLIADKYPHIMKEAMIQYGASKKLRHDLRGVMQYVPIDVWAMTMFHNAVDTVMSEHHVLIEDYDEDGKAVVNWFILGINGKEKLIESRDILIASLQHIAAVANDLGTSIAIPKEFLFYDKEKIIETLFGDKKLPLTLEIWS